MSIISAGTSSERTTSVSSSTPKATMKAICTRNARGITISAANVAASTTPAEVITPPVVVSPRSTPCRLPCASASSRTRDIRKML
jgi:hypothetical protein